MPEFNLLGFSMHDWGRKPQYQNKTGIDAFGDFFGFAPDKYEFESLVAHDFDAPPSVIADRIDAMIAAELLRRAADSTDAKVSTEHAGQMERA